MQNQKRVAFLLNVLVLAALVGLVLGSWLFGHILRYSIPALWHPPIQETDPRFRPEVEFGVEGIPRQVALPGLPAMAGSVRVKIPGGQGFLPADCVGTTYFTSLPAKCLASDGRLVQVGRFESNVILIPQNK